ncbi:DUF4403 family protein [Sphingomonas sp. MS122]|uniref:DUF4403 family protein n=1 Tax=Sphingomonas sp. MS122 TaxID=3412683 RepID=UPI003C2D1CEC
MQRGLARFAVVSLTPLAACTDQASNPAPPRLTEPLVLKEQASTIRLPVTIPMAELEKAINAEVPLELHRIDEPQQACIKTKSKLLPDISCRLVGSVRRGRIRLTGSGNVLRIAMPVSATVRAENIGKIIKRETATGAMNVTARVTLGLSRDWRPHAKVAADYAWTNKIGIDILGRRITFASKVDPKLHQVLAGLERSLPRHLDKVQARSKVQRVWAKGFTSVRVKTDPQIWARFTPERVGFSGYSVQGGNLVVGFAAQARTETVLGERPDDPSVTPLPNLMGHLPGRGINVHVPVLVLYPLLERAALAELQKPQFASAKLRGGLEAKAEYHGVTIYGTPQNQVAVGVDMTLRTGTVTTKGTVWFVAAPVVDIPRRVVGVRDLVVAGDTDSKAFNLLVQMVNQTALRQRMMAAIRYDFTKDYDDGLAKADAWLAEQPFEGFVFKGAMGRAEIREVRIAPEGFLVEADATATASLTHDPHRAAVLVAERRAKRAARERARALEAAKAAR